MGATRAAAVHAALFIVAAASNTSECTNPVFVDPSRYGNGLWLKLNAITETMPVTPVIVPHHGSGGVSMCSTFAGTLGCCDNATLVAAEEAYNEAVVALQGAALLANSINYTDALIDQIRVIADGVCFSNPECIQKVEAAVATTRGSLSSAVHAMTNDIAACTVQLEAYVMGMVCFACSLTPAAFLVNETGTDAIIMADETCDVVYDACSPLLQDGESLVLASESFVTAIMAAIGIPVISLGPLDPANYFDICDAHEFSTQACKQYVCGSLLNGFSIPELSFTSSLSAPFDVVAERSSAAVEQVADLAKGLNIAQAGAASSIRASRPRKRSSNQNSYGGFNDYVSDDTPRYSPLSVGCADVNCGRVSTGGGDGVTGLEIAAIATGSAVAGGILATFAATRWKQHSRHQPLLSADTATSGAPYTSQEA